MFDLYQQQILERYKEPRFSGEIADMTHTAEGINASCGDEVRMDIRLEGDQIAEIKHTCRACAVCSASADLLSETLTHKSREDALTYSTEQLTELLGIPLSPIRLKCALLPLEALKQALTD